MIQKKYMWGLLLGLLSSGMFVQNINAMFSRKKPVIRERDPQQESYKSASELWEQFYGQYLSNDTTNMENVGEKWLSFKNSNERDLQKLEINSPEELAQRAQVNVHFGPKDEDIVSVKKDDSDIASGSEDKGKEEEEKSSSVVAASKEEIAAAIQALLKLSEHLTLSSPIKNQDEWKVFCNAFADLVESGKWNPDQAYTWDGSKLQ